MNERDMFHQSAIEIVARKLYWDFERVCRYRRVEPESFYENWSKGNLGKVTSEFKSAVFRRFLERLRENRNGIV